MFKLRKKQFKKIGYFFKKFPRILAENAFLISLVLFFIAMVLGGFLFYKYYILVERAESQPSQKLLYFDKQNFETVLKAWQDRQINFQAADSKQYLNPFEIAP